MEDKLSYEKGLTYLKDDSWKTLDISGKVAVLQAVEQEFARRENRYPCQVSPKYMPKGKGDGILMGSYSPVTKDIAVNIEQLSPDSKYGNDYTVHLDTVLHEGRHAYQDQAARGVIQHSDKGELEQWRLNMAPGNHIPYEQNPRGYYNQPIEKDARLYAEKMVRQIKQEQQQMHAQEDQGVFAAKAVYLEQMNAYETSDLSAAQVQYLNQHDDTKDETRSTRERAKKGIAKR